MRELPGFYFDEERKRYFPLSSQKYRITSSTSSKFQDAIQEESHRPRKYPNRLKYSFYDSLIKQKHSVDRISRSAAAHQIALAQVVRGNVNRIWQHPNSNTFTSFCVYETMDQELSFALGDQQGFCLTGSDGGIHPEYIMTSPISSICFADGITLYAYRKSYEICLPGITNVRKRFTSFGPRPAILIKSANSPDVLRTLTPAKLQDVRASQLRGSSLVLGMRKQALHFPDINAPHITNSMYVGSDVFTLCQEDFTVWTGARNGSVHVFDTRVNQGMEILRTRFSTGKHPTSITHIHRIHEFELLISTLNGRVEVYDTRFIRRTKCPDPTLTIQSHVDHNQVLHNLGLAIDPFEEFLYMAGQDCRIRAWSLRNGKQIECPPPHLGSPSTVLNHEFPSPVLGMQTTRCKNQNSLWLISGSHIEQYEIP